VKYVPLLAAILGLALAAPATAQPATFNQSIGGGAHFISAFDNPDLRNEPGLNASWRYWAGNHLGVEASFNWFGHDRSTDFSMPSFTMPDGTITDPMHVSVSATSSWYGLGFNVLGRIPIGSRTSVVAGGGPGFYHERGRNEENFNGAMHVITGDASHFGLQGLTELEVRATDRLSVFGGMHIQWRDVRYPDAGFAYPIVGVRMGF
jgi:outer membrane protein with beta-barrel domain